MSNSLANFVEVSTQVAARLTLLNAFIRSGSVDASVARSDELPSWKVTWKADHPVAFCDCGDGLYRRRWLSVVPGEMIMLCNLGKFIVHVSRLRVILIY